jgi:hypothetical protein
VFALALMVAQCLTTQGHLDSLALMVGVALAPLLYQLFFRARQRAGG